MEVGKKVNQETGFENNLGDSVPERKTFKELCSGG